MQLVHCLSLLLLPFRLLLVNAAPGPGKGWHFVQNGTSGVLALEAIIVSPTLAIFFDLVNDDPLQINGHSAWGALWNMETNTATALDVKSDTFCASGGFLSNGTMVSVGGNTPFAQQDTALDGRMGLRLFEPCEDANGVGCTLFEDPANLHINQTRWYTSTLRIFDGSLMIVGGTHEAVAFYNIDPVDSFEFFPPKDGGVPRPSEFLARSGPANLFPRVFALPDGRVLMIAGNQTIIYDIETKEEIRLPDIPNGVKVTNPFDGTATLLPLSPPNYVPEILVCGGTTTSDLIPQGDLSSQDPASDQCSRLTITPAGIKKGWQVERMLEPRTLLEMVLIPNGQVLIINGARTGYATIGTVKDPIGNQSNSDHAVVTPSLYTPSAPLGRRISNKDLPASDIFRVYHSTVTLTPKGNILVAGSNPNAGPVVVGTKFPTEYRVQYLNPPFMTVPRPQILSVPKKIAFNQQFTISVSIPQSLKSGKTIQVSLMDLGFSTHGFHSSSRLVFLTAQISRDGKSLIVRAPPNNKIYPPGPGYIYLTIDDVSSEGMPTLIGNGLSPPVANQGVFL